MGQALPTAEASASSGAFVSFDGMKTHVKAFTFNALGADAGLYFQPFSLLGAEVRGGTYPMYARFSQTPITAGVRIGPRQARLGRPLIYGYFGAGYSKAQNAGPHYVATRAAWSPCWQASQALDIPVGRFRWKLYEATWTETYSPLGTLGSLSLSTGLVYTFR
jgi:hypothetical protein